MSTRPEPESPVASALQIEALRSSEPSRGALKTQGGPVKFTDGYWMMRPGIQASYPARVLDGTVGPDSLVVHAPCYRFRDREDLLRGPALTVAFAAPWRT